MKQSSHVCQTTSGLKALCTRRRVWEHHNRTVERNGNIDTFWMWLVQYAFKLRYQWSFGANVSWQLHIWLTEHLRLSWMGRHLSKCCTIELHHCITWGPSVAFALLITRTTRETSLPREAYGACFLVIQTERKDGESLILKLRRWSTPVMLYF